MTCNNAIHESKSRKIGFSYTSVKKALDMLRSKVKLEPALEVVSLKNVFKRVLIDNLLAKADIPPHNTSTLDGYAVRATDISSASPNNPVILKISGKGNLIKVPRNHLKSGQAFGILTGGYLPKGSDTILGVEEVELGSGVIHVDLKYPKNRGVYPRGEDVKGKAITFRKGHIIRAQDIGLLGMMGITKIPVVRKPRVVIIPVGSELTDDITGIEKGKTPATHQLVVSAMVEEAGGEAIVFPSTVDDTKILSREINRALKIGDIILTIGGTSLGEADLVEDVVNSLGNPGMVVHGVKLDPGRVAGFGVIKGKPIILLPGLIQSTINAFIVFGYTAMELAIGHVSSTFGFKVSATLTSGRDFRKKFFDFVKITYVRLSFTGIEFEAEPILGETAMISVLTKANGYISSPEDKKKLEKGERVLVNLLPGFSFTSG